MRTEIAAAYERLGDVLGNPTMTNLGQPARAVECYEKALNIRQRLLDSQPANVALVEGVEKTLAMIDRGAVRARRPRPRRRSEAPM
jgi:hypothetical protein